MLWTTSSWTIWNIQVEFPCDQNSCASGGLSLKSKVIRVSQNKIKEVLCRLERRKFNGWPSGALLERGWGGRLQFLPLLWEVFFVPWALAIGFCPHFPKPGRSTLLEIIKVTLRYLDTTIWSLPFEISGCAPDPATNCTNILRKWNFVSLMFTGMVWMVVHWRY